MFVIRGGFIVAILIFTFFSQGAGAFTGKPLVGIAPFKNQRETIQHDWLGFYIQASLQSCLSASFDFSFHPANTIRLWAFHANSDTRISNRTSIQIVGSFLKVLDFGVLTIDAYRFDENTAKKQFSFQFSNETFDKALNDACLKIATWLESKAVYAVTPSPYDWNDSRLQELFKLRLAIFEPDSIPEAWLILRVKEIMDANTYPEFIPDLAEGMILLAMELPEKEKALLLEETENRLRKAAVKANDYPRIHGLLAEVFYLRQQPNEWVVQAARQELKINSNDPVALLMLVLVQQPAEADERSYLQRLQEVNPWLWPDKQIQTDGVQFQNGLFSAELSELLN